ncbi:MAG: riboflavin kinase, partial [Bacteroidales bacterium]
RPTLDLEHVTIEAHLLDYHGDLYGREVSFHFLERLRDEMRFSSLSHLKEQLKKDRQASEDRLRELRNQYFPSDRWLMMNQ